MLNNFLYVSVPWDAWDDDVSCKWPHLWKKVHTLALISSIDIYYRFNCFNQKYQFNMTIGFYEKKREPTSVVVPCPSLWFMCNLRWSYPHNPWRSWTTNCAFAWRGLLVIWQGGAPQQLCLINYLAFIYHFHFQHSAWENKDSAQFSLCFGYQVGLLDQFPFQRSAFTPEEKEIIWKNENRLMCSAVNCKKT